MTVISVVIPTSGRVEQVKKLALSLLDQDAPSFEIVIVAEPEEFLVLTSLAGQDERIRVVETPVPGTTRARNIGVAASRGAIIVFLDDDVDIDDRHFLNWHAAAYGQDPKIGGTGGKILEDKPALPGPDGQILGVGNSGEVYPSSASDVPQDITAPRGGNMSFRRDVIDAVGGFDQNFVGNAMREETDFSLRVVKAGFRIRFEPRAAVRHLALPYGGSRRTSRRQWYEDFFTNEMYFYRKHFAHRSPVIFFWRKFRPILACMFYYGHGNPRWLATPWRGLRRGWLMAKEKKS